MKSAEQWCKESEQAWESGDGEACTLIVVDESIVRQIQLDAMREGMRRAAKHVYGNETHEDIEKAVLTTAEQLTEKDL